MTDTPALAELTTTCEGVGVPMIAVLLLPGLIILLPSVSSLDVAGLFNLTFRDLKKSVEEQKKKIDDVASDIAQIRIAQETLVQVGFNLNLYQNAGDVVQRGVQQDRSGQKISLEEFEQLPIIDEDA